MFAPSLAYSLNAGFVPVRKPGKLPAKTVSQTYELEYGTDRLEMHEDAIGKGERVLIVDDVIATGGTARAAAKLVEGLGGKVVAASASSSSSPSSPAAPASRATKSSR